MRKYIPTNREKITRLMYLPKELQNYDIDEQYWYIHQIIIKLKRDFFTDDSIIQHGKYIENQKQEELWQSILQNFQMNNYIAAYKEMINYLIAVDNTIEYYNLYEIEINRVKSVLIGIDKKIIETVNINEIYKKMINELNINSEFHFRISQGPNCGLAFGFRRKKFFHLDNKSIYSFWMGKEKDINDEEVIIKVKETILKYKNEILYFSNKQESKDGEFSDPYNEEIEEDFKGDMGLFNFCVYNIPNHKELNSFYEKFQKELFSIVFDDLLDVSSNEKYSGKAGMSSIKNILVN